MVKLCMGGRGMGEGVHEEEEVWVKVCMTCPLVVHVSPLWCNSVASMMCTCNHSSSSDSQKQQDDEVMEE